MYVYAWRYEMPLCMHVMHTSIKSNKNSRKQTKLMAWHEHVVDSVRRCVCESVRAFSLTLACASVRACVYVHIRDSCVRVSMDQ